MAAFKTSKQMLQRDLDIIWEYIIDDFATTASIGAARGMSASRVSQVIKKTVRKVTFDQTGTGTQHDGHINQLMGDFKFIVQVIEFCIKRNCNINLPQASSCSRGVERVEEMVRAVVAKNLSFNGT